MVVLQGVIVYFRVVDGEMRVGDSVKLINTGIEHQIIELGVLAPKPVQVFLLEPLQMLSIFTFYKSFLCCIGLQKGLFYCARNSSNSWVVKTDTTGMQMELLVSILALKISSVRAMPILRLTDS